jgi:hypothetical protein
MPESARTAIGHSVEEPAAVPMSPGSVEPAGVADVAGVASAVLAASGSRFEEACCQCFAAVVESGPACFATVAAAVATDECSCSEVVAVVARKILGTIRAVLLVVVLPWLVR